MRSHASAAVSALEGYAGLWLRFVSNHVSHGIARQRAGSGATRNDQEFFSPLSEKEREALVATLRNLATTNGLKKIPMNEQGE